MQTKTIFLFYCILTLFTLSACSHTTQFTKRESMGVLDTPKFHASQGYKALQAGNLSKAQIAFKNALELDNSYVSALAGMAISRAELTSDRPVSIAEKQTIQEEVNDLLEQAESKATTKKETGLVKLAKLRSLSALKLPQDSWYNLAKESFSVAVKVTALQQESNYYMAVASMHQGDYQFAHTRFKAALQLKGDYTSQAENGLEKLQEIERAIPQSQFGKAVAMKKEITRAELVALLSTSFDLKRIFRFKGENQKSKAAYQVPDAQKATIQVSDSKIPKAIDLTGHPMEEIVNSFLHLSIRGLEPDPQHKFHPDESVTRASFAVALESILAHATRNLDIQRTYIGQTSPFSDVATSIWYYNAVRTVTLKNLLSPQDPVNNSFVPLGSVSGSQAILAIVKLKKLIR